MGIVTKKLDVSAPFHCSLMQPAREHIAALLQSHAFAFTAPEVPLIANVTAASVSTFIVYVCSQWFMCALQVQDAAVIKELLVSQITSTVRWSESILHAKAQGVADYLEIGAKVLTGLNKQIDPSAHCL